MAREEQLEFDFDQSAANSGYIGTFGEFLRLDPKKIVGITVRQSELLSRLIAENDDVAREPPVIHEDAAQITENMVMVWTPFGDGRLLSGLAVPFRGTTSINRRRYEELLQDRLEELINANPKWAKDLLSASPEHHPNLYAIALYDALKQWAIQIMMSDEMMIRLNSVDWDKGEFSQVPADELPRLDELIEQL